MWASLPPLVSLRETPGSQTRPRACVLRKRSPGGRWTIRQLDRETQFHFYERTALSRDKAALLGESVGRVGVWRADCRLRWVIHSFRGGPQSGCPDLVSSPRRLERSVRFSSHYAHLFASCLGL